MATLDEDCIRLIDEREQARSAKDFTTADRIRETLKARGIELYDKDRTFHNTRTGARGVFGRNMAGGSGGSAATTTTLDDASIHALLMERERARAAKNFPQADKIREQLQSFGVEVQDKERMWSCPSSGRRGGIPSATSAAAAGGFLGGCGYGGGGGGGCSGGSMNMMMGCGGGMMQQQSQYQDQRQQQQHHHASPQHQQPYSYPHQDRTSSSNGSSRGGGGGLSELDITQTVLQREAARRNKNYVLADQIRESLRATGIEVFDQAKFWQCSLDGRVGLIGGCGGAWGVFNDGEIGSILTKRDEAKQLKDWPTADRIRDELRQRGIEVYDKDREWRAQDGRRGPFPPQPSSSQATAVGAKRSREDEGEGSSSSRHHRGDDRGDDDGHGSRGDDGDGSRGADGGGGGGGGGAGGGSGRGGGEPASEAEIRRLLALREGFRKEKDWQAADGVREELRGCGIEVYDKEKEWRSYLGDGRKGPIVGEGVAACCSLSAPEVQALVGKREEARRAKDFSLGDSIREQLRVLGVDLLDKERTWRANSGLRGSYGGGGGGGCGGGCGGGFMAGAHPQYQQQQQQYQNQQQQQRY